MNMHHQSNYDDPRVNLTAFEVPKGARSENRTEFAQGTTPKPRGMKAAAGRFVGTSVIAAVTVFSVTVLVSSVILWEEIGLVMFGA